MFSIFKNAALTVLLFTITCSLAAQTNQSPDHNKYYKGSLAFTFVKINATMSNDSLFVSWESHEEQQQKTFDIEVSKDGISFVKIGSLPAKVKEGSTTQQLHYVYRQNLRVSPVKFASVIGGVLLLLFIPFARRKTYQRVLMIAMVSAGFSLYSCNKSGIIPQEEISDYKQIEYARVAMVSINDEIGRSLVVKVLKQ